MNVFAKTLATLAIPAACSGCGDAPREVGTSAGGSGGATDGAPPDAHPPNPCAPAICPPGPPSSGAGSAVYAHTAVRVTTHGAGNDQYWLYEPAEPAPATAPVVVYLHGYAALAPTLYDALLHHLARRGSTVVFPLYGDLVSIATYEVTARKAVAAALAELGGPAPHVRPSGRFALAGHSLGGMLALRLAATTTTSPALPQADVIVLHEPAGKTFVPLDLLPAALSAIAPSTRLLVIQAETTVADPNSAALDAWSNTSTIARKQKSFLLGHSDDYGSPPLVSDHLGVQAGTLGLETRPLDAIDWWGYFRPTDAALEEAVGAAVYSVFCNDPAPACSEVRNAGQWSDGTAVREIENAADLGI